MRLNRSMSEHKGLPIISFPDRTTWESWLSKNGAKSSGIWLKFAKKKSGEITISKPEAIQAALCFGWIDGQLDRFDDAFWLVRFTPRSPKSKWSQINREMALRLIADGRMRPTGHARIAEAKSNGCWDAAYAPQSRAEIPGDLQVALSANPKAKSFFATLKGPNRYAILYRIGNAKTEKTRSMRVRKFIEMLNLGQTIYPQKE